MGGDTWEEKKANGRWQNFMMTSTFQQKILAWTKARKGSLGGCSFPQR